MKAFGLSNLRKSDEKGRSFGYRSQSQFWTGSVMDTLSVLYHFLLHVGGQMEEVLELQGLECHFGGSFGVLKSGKFEVSREQMGFEGFLVNLRSQSDLLLRCNLVFIVCFLSIK